MNTNKLTNANCQARFVIVIFTNKYTLVFGHHLNQLTKLYHSFIKLMDVQFAVHNLYIALCLIMIYNNA